MATISDFTPHYSSVLQTTELVSNQCTALYPQFRPVWPGFCRVSYPDIRIWLLECSWQFFEQLSSWWLSKLVMRLVDRLRQNITRQAREICNSGLMKGQEELRNLSESFVIKWLCNNINDHSQITRESWLNEERKGDSPDMAAVVRYWS